MSTVFETQCRRDNSASPLGQASITGVTITPVAFADPPLLNTVGVHEPYALRAIVQLHTDAGVTGLGETYGDAAHLARLRMAANAVTGADPFNINDLRARVARRWPPTALRAAMG